MVVSDNGKDALNLIRKTVPDVVLLDIKMPGMDGITTLKGIKAQDPDIKVIIMTGFASLDTALEALKFGAFDYIKKPFDKLDTVVNTIRLAWERRKSHLEGRNLKTGQERKIYELKVLYNTSRIMGQCLDRREMIIQLLDSLSKIVEYDLAISILRKSPGSEELLLHVVKPSGYGFIEEAKDNLIDAFNSVSQTKIVPDISFDKIMGGENIKEENECNNRIARKLNSFLNVPMMKEESLIGMINLSSHSDRSYTTDDIRFIYTMVSQVPSAMQRVDQIESAERSTIDTLTRSMIEGVIMMDENFEVVLVNPSALKIMGQGDLNLEFVQNSLGMDLRELREQMEEEQLDLVRQRVKINSGSYELVASIIKGATEGFMGFVITLHRFAKENTIDSK